MPSPRLVELADRYSRRRAWIAAIAGGAFLAVQFLAWPRVFGAAEDRGRIDFWVINVLALLAVLATGGGIVGHRRVRALVQDELARLHLQTAVRVGFWVAMALALGLYLGPWFRAFTARQASYVIITGSVAMALLTFAGLEHRAHADG